MEERASGSEEMLRRFRDDLVATLGPEYVPKVSELAALAGSSLRGERLAVKVIEDMQQYLDDTAVDTTWPVCPRHGGHPLWVVDGSWCCPQDGTEVAVLGELRGVRS